MVNNKALAKINEAKRLQLSRQANIHTLVPPVKISAAEIGKAEVKKPKKEKDKEEPKWKRPDRNINSRHDKFGELRKRILGRE